jgi:LacI family transcriptional regulator
VRLLHGEADRKLLADEPTLLDCPLVIRGSVAAPHAD